MIRLAAALLLLCKPVELRSFVAKSNSKRAMLLEVTPKSLTLRESGAVLWSTGQGGFAVMFADDDSWVAVKGPYPVGSVLIAATRARAKPVWVDPLTALSDEEKKRVPVTDCGVSWFKGWKNTPQTLELTVDQGDAAPLTLYVEPSGRVIRERAR
ncbi:MAG: hypothetical protein IPJ65_02460 [Archangiaceae bacterium]|nr:hypothetical protein [Archangiaceae bacterium]